jgi:hypothetical protein
MECSICLCDLSFDTVTTPCRHTFHAACLKQWRQGTCPNCRSLLLSDEDARRQHYESFVRSQFPSGVSVHFTYDENDVASWQINKRKGIIHWMSQEWRRFYRRADEVTQCAYRLSNRGGAGTIIYNCERGAPSPSLVYCRLCLDFVTNDIHMYEYHMMNHDMDRQFAAILSLAI